MGSQRSFYLSLTVIMLAALASPTLQAGNLATPCVQDTLADYDTNTFGTNGSSQCSIGILNFGNFFLDPNQTTGTGGAILLSASDIQVTPIFTGDPHALPQAPALELSGNFSVGAGQTATYVIDWFFAIDAGPEMDGADLAMDPAGAVTVTQEYCPDGGAVGDCNHPEGFLQDTTIPLHLFDHQSFLVTSFAQVRTTIFLDGTNGPSSFSNLIGTSDVVDSTAPEPATLLLSLPGVLSLAGLRKRARRP
jgi:hypothetical protein